VQISGDMSGSLGVDKTHDFTSTAIGLIKKLLIQNSFELKISCEKNAPLFIQGSRRVQTP
jgi:hypothetical protein